MTPPRWVNGDQLGIDFPPTIEALREAGPDFLTAAFQATGVLAPDNAVAEITATREFFGGGMGRKLQFSVAYMRAQPGLSGELFAKFPRDFGDPLRDLFGPLMEPECRFALLSRRPDFPVRVPRCYFADFNTATTSGLLITERIAYGTGGIEPHQDKCLDFGMKDPLSHYRALTVALARLAGAHKSGLFGPDVQRLFPFDAQRVDAGSAIPFTQAQLIERLDRLRLFARDAAQLFAPGLADAAFLGQFAEDAKLVMQLSNHIRYFLNSQADLIALCHWNGNVDNAWFWRNADSGLQAGLLDWGSVGQMNLAQAFFGMTCGAEIDFLDAHRTELAQLMVEEYRSAGGPAVSADDLLYQVKLATGLLGVAWMLDAPALIENELPQMRSLSGRNDPALRANFLARAQLQLLMVLLNDWKTGDFGAVLRDFGNRGGGLPPPG